MPEESLTLAGALGLDDEAARGQLADAVAGGAGVRAAAGKLNGSPSPGLMGAVAGQVAERLSKLLDLPLTDVLAGAWARYPELAGYCDPQRYPPEETVLVTLAKHRVASTHRPQVELRVNEKSVATLEFVASVVVDLEGVHLSVRGGRIRGLHAGKATFEGMLGLRELPQPILRRTKDVTLPGTLSFGEGIPIRPGVEAEAGAA